MNEAKAEISFTSENIDLQASIEAVSKFKPTLATLKYFYKILNAISLKMC